MKRLLFSIVALASVPAWSSSISYDNTTSDTFLSVFYSAGPYRAIGDMVTLGGTGRNLDIATVQFFNGGTQGRFISSLSVYNANFVLLATGSVGFISAPALSSFNVTFPLGGIVVPDTVVVMVSISNGSAGVDVGLNLFYPPSIGSSDSTFYQVQDASIRRVAANVGEGNLFLQLQTSVGTPEPSTFWLLAVGAPAMFLLRPRRTPSA